MKACAKCLVKKPSSDFYKRNLAKDGLRTVCKLCDDIGHKKYAVANRDKFLAYKAEWRAPRVEELRAKAKARYALKAAQLNAETLAWCRKNPDKARATKSAWKKRNPAQGRVDAANRRATKMQATPRWANAEVIKQIYRNAIAAGLTVDHSVPLISGLVCGLHCEANLELMPREKNLQKSNRYWPDMP